MALMSLVESAKRFSDDGRLGAQDARPVHILFNKTEGRGGESINQKRVGINCLLSCPLCVLRHGPKGSSVVFIE